MTSTKSNAQNSEQNNAQNNAQNAYANQTIQTLLNRRSIRAFKNEPISEDIAKTLEAAAQRAACSQFLNDWSAIKITSKDLKQKLSKLGNQTYIATAPLLYVFIIDQHRNAAIARKNGIDADGSDFTLKTRLQILSIAKRRCSCTTRNGNSRRIAWTRLRNPWFNFE